MAGALGGFGHARRGDDLSGELIDGANVNELAGLASSRMAKTSSFMSGRDSSVPETVIGGWSDLCRFGRKLAILFEPLFAASVDEATPCGRSISIARGRKRRTSCCCRQEKNGGAVGMPEGAEKFSSVDLSIRSRRMLS